jgi:hypothetical protein
VIRVRDMQGRLFTDTFAPGDDLDHIARRLLKEKSGYNAFYGAIQYPKASYH